MSLLARHIEPMLNKSCATADQYITTRATPPATKLPRLTLTARGIDVSSQNLMFVGIQMKRKELTKTFMMITI